MIADIQLNWKRSDCENGAGKYSRVLRRYENAEIYGSTWTRNFHRPRTYRGITTCSSLFLPSFLSPPFFPSFVRRASTQPESDKSTRMSIPLANILHNINGIPLLRDSWEETVSRLSANFSEVEIIREAVNAMGNLSRSRYLFLVVVDLMQPVRGQDFRRFETKSPLAEHTRPIVLFRRTSDHTRRSMLFSRPGPAKSCFKWHV